MNPYLPLNSPSQIVVCYQLAPATSCLCLLSIVAWQKKRKKSGPITFSLIAEILKRGKKLALFCKRMNSFSNEISTDCFLFFYCLMSQYLFQSTNQNKTIQPKKLMSMLEIHLSLISSRKTWVKKQVDTKCYKFWHLEMVKITKTFSIFEKIYNPVDFKWDQNFLQPWDVNFTFLNVFFWVSKF